MKKMKTMKKKNLIKILIGCLIISTCLITLVILPNFKKIKEYQEQKEYERQLKKATIVVELKKDLSTIFLEDVKVSQFIENINGTIIDDYKIDTSIVGEKEIKFEYINDENIKIPYQYTINIKDITPPSIWLNNTYSITTDYNGSLLEDIVCADDYDDNPNCEIIGEYDTKKVGNYNLKFQATDNSGNITTKDFTLKVSTPTASNPSEPSKPTYTYLSDIIKNHKTDKTKIGIDVSSWQGDINFQAVKDAGVEFVFIRVGSTRGIGSEYFVDKKFQQNIEGFNKVGIPVGIYFYSYANSKESAINDANWVLENIKGYRIDLPIAYDWESWSFFNEFHQSFYSTTRNAKAFLDTISNAGYTGVLYSSKNYLEKVWYDTGYETWLAHYTKQTSYKGQYRYWQMCSNGRVDGINGNVDINIMYL